MTRTTQLMKRTMGMLALAGMIAGGAGDAMAQRRVQPRPDPRAAARLQGLINELNRQSAILAEQRRREALRNRSTQRSQVFSGNPASVLGGYSTNSFTSSGGANIPYFVIGGQRPMTPAEAAIAAALAPSNQRMIDTILAPACRNSYRGC